MSSVGVFLLNTNTPQELFESLKATWTDKRIGRDVILIERKSRDIRFTTEKPLSEKSQKMIEEGLKYVRENIHTIIEPLVKSMGMEPPLPVSEMGPGVSPILNILKGWACILQYYYHDDEDRRDFLESARIIINHAEDDVIYYRQEDVSKDDDSPDDDDIRIDVNSILKYEPSMAECDRYIILKNPEKT